MRQKLFYPLVFIVFVLLAFLLGSKFAPTEPTGKNISNPEQKSPTSESSFSKPKTNAEELKTTEVLVKKAVDGDTIELENGQRLRYIGIDTPETVDPKQSVQCYGKEAASKNKELVEGKKVRLEMDVSNEDRYGRLLRYVFLGEIFVNEYLVREGFAKASSYPPDVKYQDKLRLAEQLARENKKGLWGSCSPNIQGAQTSSQNYSVSLSPGADCQIKGNISSSGEKIYHVPSGTYYNKTVIDESKGERWFCSETEASQAGWRKSKI